MVLNIRNAKADLLAEKIARRTGETRAQAVITALQEHLTRVQRASRRTPLADKLVEIARQCASLPIRDGRSAEAILGYGEDGLPR